MSGNFLGTTKEGFTGKVLVYSGEEKHDWKSMTAKAACKINSVKNLQDADLSSRAYSKIYTHILLAGGFKVSGLFGFAVSVMNGTDLFNSPDTRTGFASNTSSSLSYSTKVTVNQEAKGTHKLLTTVENIQNALGAHELIGHGQYRYNDEAKTHHKAYELQINNQTWDKSTPEFKAHILEMTREFYRREVPNYHLSNEYLKYSDLWRLYKK